MDVNRLTQKSQEALQGAQTKATRFGRTEVDGEHLLFALLEPPEGLVPRLLSAAGAGAGNADQAPRLSERFTVQAIPTLVVIDQGRVLTRRSGAAPAPAPREWVDHALAA
ncbi:hypothetical protein Skr01_29100 [Sphaerisporangium krabiense]|uniref:Clp R domain-containing protein n=1 Tax=Sphaerisporangium krabiense TaxID=763782 RepID=A0A7W8Z9Z7_9ACTN|nr:thioredoxin family protein [Sphaerisporangium krabiense]MBB5630224.1 hypothetical protein [Sphaerisporangium krabiense]GII62825.1 hypothetical protein Skr01_29100 [Sphaerisporangium krabiense]